MTGRRRSPLTTVLTTVMLAAGIAGLGAQNGTWPVLKVTDFNVAGDGRTDDTQALQKAIDMAVAQHATLLFPPGPGGGCYASGSLLIRNASHLTLRGTGGVICWRGARQGAPRVGLGYQGQISDLTIEGMELTGAGGNPMYSTGIAGPSGSHLKNIVIRKNYIHDVSLGISLNADNGGTIDHFLIVENRLENILGTDVGFGYGIHQANGSGQPSHGVIAANTLIGCQRNSIYEAKGDGIIVANNTILNHGGNRQRLPYPLTGLQIARGSEILVYGNVVDGAQDGSMVIATDQNIAMHDITVIGNKFLNPRGTLPMVTIGSAAPSRESFPERVFLYGNSFYEDGRQVVPIQLNSGKNVRIVGNDFRVFHAPGSLAAIEVRGQDEDAGTARYSDQFDISYNDIRIGAHGSASGVRIFPKVTAGAVNTRFVGNQVDAPSGALAMDSRVRGRAPMVNQPSADGHIRVQMMLNTQAPAVPASCTTVVARVPGAKIGDTVYVSSMVKLPLNFYLTGAATAQDEITVKWCQMYGAPMDPDGTGGSYVIDVWKP